MAESPFAFFRGSARIMAADLASQPDTGLEVQLCGDAHLANFGVYGSPERVLVFDLNDFDETLPGPFEWDVKRLAASVAIAGQHNGLADEVCRLLAVETAQAYRTTIAELSKAGWLDTWYKHIAVDELVNLLEREGASKKRTKRAKRFAKRARSKDHLRAATKLVEATEDGHRFRSSPPLLQRFEDLVDNLDAEQFERSIAASLDSYRASLPAHIRQLLDRYTLVDMALKVVGVGSVGTRCAIGLFVGRDASDVLILQVKEATKSVLADHLPASQYRLQGRRVVEGQRLMQASSDIFLGWSTSTTGHHYYWRQLKDWKGSVDLDGAGKGALGRYAALCGLTLARAHAVSGDPRPIAAYLGSGTVFDQALGEFALRYAEQNAQDYEEFKGAIAAGRLSAAEADG